ncbi:S-adenosyl-L-methionine-dependent methyltransferase [Atractiella rhizophila]|nr:S-adenosyl-L-methionine-dependent methyltransferase [Atractiella rhizophila]
MTEPQQTTGKKRRANNRANDDSLFTKTPEEILSQNREVLPPFFVEKHKREAAKNWDKFYTANTTNFFKDRHWTSNEFTELDELLSEGDNPIVLEVGCGVGNFVFPLLKKYEKARFYACDFSAKAIALTKEKDEYKEHSDRVYAFVHDLTSPELLSPKLIPFPPRVQPTTAPSSSLIESSPTSPPDLSSPIKLDMITLLFVLSAIPPALHSSVFQTLSSLLPSGGQLLFRDYALHDPAQLRFHTRPSASYSSPSLMDKDKPLYRRGDGTMSYFFTEEEVTKIAEETGWRVKSVEVKKREMENRGEGWKMERKFIQAVFEKP